MSSASGLWSRRIGWFAGLGWLLLALTPGAAAFVVAIPVSVLGAAYFFSATFTIALGIRMLAQRLLDPKRIFAAGAAIVAGLMYIAPQIQVDLGEALTYLFGSAVVFAMTTAIVLNLISRLGETRKIQCEWCPAEGPALACDFVRDACRGWTTTTDAAARTSSFIWEFALAASRRLASDVTVKIGVERGESRILFEFLWQGEALAGKDMEDSPDDFFMLSLNLMRHWTDHLEHSTIRGDYSQKIVTAVNYFLPFPEI